MKPRFDKLSTNGKNRSDLATHSVHPELVEGFFNSFLDAVRSRFHSV